MLSSRGVLKQDAMVKLLRNFHNLDYVKGGTRALLSVDLEKSPW